MNRLNRKGYYFIIDALIGSTIIFLSLMIIIGNNMKTSNVQYNYEMAEEYSSFLLNTKLEDLTNPYVDYLITNGYINNTKVTIMEQVDLFYFENKTGNATEMIKNLTESLMPGKYGFSYTIINGSTNTSIYNREYISIEDANIIIASRKLTFLQVNSTTMFGPALTEVKVWV